MAKNSKKKKESRSISIVLDPSKPVDKGRAAMLFQHINALLYEDSAIDTLFFTVVGAAPKGQNYQFKFKLK